MPKPPPEYGTLIVAVLLIMTLAFAGLWIMRYAQDGSPPWNLARWFLIAGAAVIVLGIGRYVRLWRDR